MSAETDRIDRNRRNKAARYVGRFLHQLRATNPRPETDKAALEGALVRVRAATPEEWAALAADLTRENREGGFRKTENPPSPETFALIVAQLEAMIGNAEAARAHADVQAAEDVETLTELTNRMDPAYRARREEEEDRAHAQAERERRRQREKDQDERSRRAAAAYLRSLQRPDDGGRTE